MSLSGKVAVCPYNEQQITSFVSIAIIPKINSCKIAYDKNYMERMGWFICSLCKNTFNELGGWHRMECRLSGEDCYTDSRFVYVFGPNDDATYVDEESIKKAKNVIFTPPKPSSPVSTKDDHCWCVIL